MQPLAIRILSLALITVSSTAAVETKYPHGGFDPRLDKFQGLLDYVHTVEKIEIKAGPKLWQAIESIPVATGVPITPEQEADLRDWLYDFLVAFSASGNDSLAAEFYLREGVNNPRALKNMEETLADWGIAKATRPLTSSKLCTAPYSTTKAMNTALARPSCATARSRCSRCRATTRAIGRTRGASPRPDSNCSKRLRRRCELASSGSSPTSRLSPKSRPSPPGRKDRSAPPSFVGWSGTRSGRCGAL